MKSYFIVGTDTDCGKTYATCELTNYIKAQKKAVCAVKPVVSGCIVKGDKLIAEDIVKLDACNGDGAPIMHSWRLKAPISPHLAARYESIRISAEEVVTLCQDVRYKDLDVLLIEGAGGLMVPLNEKETWVDFLSLSKIPVILVVGMRLGCINHALLTAYALKQQNITCAGWIANCIDKDMLCLQDNIDTLCEKIELPLLGVIPYNGVLSPIAINSLIM